MKMLALGVFLFAIPAVATGADDPVFQAYLASLFTVPGKAQEEFQSIATTSPLLTSYALALFTKNRCETPDPSPGLEAAAGGTPAFYTEAGKRVFAVAGVVATMKFPSLEDEKKFCASAQALIDTAEKYVVDHK
ncbi:hypothetical protein RQ479_06285 [Mesorhizobium sp. ISC25]|uniref:hypothetical protein n=1 Tax=Mesorhizobium sp. ISC25 TaxID=3077335 RepID=UPI0035D920B7